MEPIMHGYETVTVTFEQDPVKELKTGLAARDV
jgi:hypothetical protein